MNPILFRLLMTVGISMLKYLRRRYGAMTKEQKAEWDRERRIMEIDDHDERLRTFAGE